MMQQFSCSKNTIKNWAKKLCIKTPVGFYKQEGKKAGRKKGCEMPEHQKQLLSNMFSGKSNPFYGKKHSKETKNKMSQNHADFTGSNNPFRNSLEKDPSKIKAHKERCQKIWDERDEKWVKNFSEKLSISMASSKNFEKPNFHKKHKCGYHNSEKCGSVFYRSSWESRMCMALDKDVNVERYSLEEFYVPYMSDGKIKNTRIDFMLYFKDKTKTMIEVKPKNLQEYKHNKLKINGLAKYCKNNNIMFEVFSLKEIEAYERSVQAI